MVELLTVIVLIGILTVTVSSRFFGRTEVADFALRDQFISTYRFSQQRAMYDQNSCYSLTIDASGFGPRRNLGTFVEAKEVTFDGDFAGLSINEGANPAPTIFFDSLGNPYTGDCGATPIGSALVLTINPGNLRLEILSTGYIRAI